MYETNSVTLPEVHNRSVGTMHLDRTWTMLIGSTLSIDWTMMPAEDHTFRRDSKQDNVWRQDHVW